MLSQTSKPKKVNKYSEVSRKSKKEEYKFGLRENVIYVGGLYEEKSGLNCVVVSRSQSRNGKQYYKVEFEDGLIIENIADVLKKIEIEKN